MPISRRFGILLSLAGLVVAAVTVAPTAAQERTVSDGVFTAEQAARGAEVFREQCAACHGAELMGSEMGAPLVGADFVRGWSGATLWEFADFTNATMPQDAPGRLTAAELNDVVAFIFQSNEYPAGSDELMIDLENEGDPITIN